MKMTRKELTPELVRQLLSYNPQTGELHWLRRALKWFANAQRMNGWNAKWAGKSAFTSVSPYGYRHGSALEVRVTAHRVAWAIYHGEWPPHDIDHINGDKLDNRIENLRAVTRKENLHNGPRRSTNTTGVTGVYARAGKWRVMIGVDSRLKHLGTYELFEEAVAARKAAEQQFGYHPNHGREQIASAA